MTKSVRIENADTSNHKVVVQVWEEQIEAGGGIAPKSMDKLVAEWHIDNPTELITQTIHSTRYLVIREATE